MEIENETEYYASDPRQRMQYHIDNRVEINREYAKITRQVNLIGSSDSDEEQRRAKKEALELTARLKPVKKFHDEQYEILKEVMELQKFPANKSIYRAWEEDDDEFWDKYPVLAPAREVMEKMGSLRRYRLPNGELDREKMFEQKERMCYTRLGQNSEKFTLSRWMDNIVLNNGETIGQTRISRSFFKDEKKDKFAMGN